MADIEKEKLPLAKKILPQEGDNLGNASNEARRVIKTDSISATENGMRLMHQTLEAGFAESRLKTQKENDRLVELMKKNVERTNRDEILEVVSNIGSINVPNEQLLSLFTERAMVEFFGNSGSTLSFLSALLKDKRNIERIYFSGSNDNLNFLLQQIIPDIEQDNLKQLSETQAENYIYLVAKFPIAKKYSGQVYPFIQSDSNLLKPLLREFPKAAHVLERTKIDEMNEYDVIKILLENDIFDFRADEAEGISNSCELREIALNLFQKLPKEKQRKLIPLFIDHFLDIDFGNIEEARKFISQLDDDNVKQKLLASLPESLDTATRTPEKILGKWQQKIQENKEYIRAIIYEDYPQEAEEVIKSVRENVFFSVNLGLPGIINFLQEKSLLSNWEVGNARYLPNIFSMHNKKDAKDETERYLGVRGKGSQEDPHPIYGAVGCFNGIEEDVGAVNLPHYGYCHIKINPAFAESTAIFFYGDSMAANLQELNSGNSVEFEKKILDLEGAILGKTLLEIDPREKEQNLYIEAIFTQGLGLENVDEIVIPKSELEKEGISIESLREKAQGIKITITDK